MHPNIRYFFVTENECLISKLKLGFPKENIEIKKFLSSIYSFNNMISHVYVCRYVCRIVHLRM